MRQTVLKEMNDMDYDLEETNKGKWNMNEGKWNMKLM